MYEQICNILKQNNIEFTDILWTDEIGGLQLNNSEDWTQYIEVPIDKGILFYFKDKKKFYEIKQRFELGFTMVFLLKEWKDSKQQEEEKSV